MDVAAGPSLNSSGHAPAYVVAGPGGLRIVGLKGATTIAKVAPPRVILDAPRGWIWFEAGAGIEVLDLRRPGARGVTVVRSVAGDFGIFYPGGACVSSNPFSVQVNLRWDGSLITARGRRLPGAAQPPGPIVNVKWLAADKKRAARGGAKPVVVRRSAAFGRTGWTLAINRAETTCALVDKKGRKRPVPGQKGLACSGPFEFDRSGSWWIARGQVCNVARCYKFPNKVFALGWMTPGRTLLLPWEVVPQGR